MDIFEHIAGVAALILGLGVTRLLESVIAAFRRRRESRLHWIPLTWAAIIFAWQMQYLWAIFELSVIVSGWTVGMFTVVVATALILFAAGALVLPDASDSQLTFVEGFRADGKWGLLCLTVYFLAGCVVNPMFWDLPFFSPLNLLAIPLAALPAAFLRFGDTSAGAALTVGCAALSVFGIVVYSPGVYL